MPSFVNRRRVKGMTIIEVSMMLAVSALAVGGMFVFVDTGKSPEAIEASSSVTNDPDSTWQGLCTDADRAFARNTTGLC